MRLIKRIFIHCSAGFGDVESIKRYWKSICYIGGVDRANINKAKDTRTEAQKQALICEIENALLYLKQFQSIDEVEILGHRDISEDKNLNGKVDSWERIKECPSFDAIPEYKHLIEKYK
jgi:N-acetylmuramoyl-L-alanine amidase